MPRLRSVKLMRAVDSSAEDATPVIGSMANAACRRESVGLLPQRNILLLYVPSRGGAS